LSRLACRAANRPAPPEMTPKRHMTEADDVLLCEARSKVARCSEETTALSFVEVVLAIFVRGSDSNAAARQCLPKKYLDFGIDAP